MNAASYSGQPPAPGSITSAFSVANDSGGFGAGPEAARTIPLPTTIGGMTLKANGILVPLFYVSSNQINFQVPWELQGLNQATLTLDGNVFPPPVPRTLTLATWNPGIFSTNQQGSGQGAVLIGGTSDYAAPVGTFAGAQPANRGEVVSIFCTGLGPVTNQPRSGEPAGPALAATASMPTVTIGGVPTGVLFSGLAPGFVGLYQVNAVVPATLLGGNAIPLSVTIGGVSSNTVTIAVQ